MVDFSSREKYKEIKELPSENAEEHTEEDQQRLRREQEDIEQKVRQQQRNFLEYSTGLAPKRARM